MSVNGFRILVYSFLMHSWSLAPLDQKEFDSQNYAIDMIFPNKKNLDRKIVKKGF